MLFSLTLNITLHTKQHGRVESWIPRLLRGHELMCVTKHSLFIICPFFCTKLLLLFIRLFHDVERKFLTLGLCMLFFSLGIMSYFCPCVQYGKNVEKLGEGLMDNHEWVMNCVIYLVFECIGIACVPTFLQRQQIRKKYGIEVFRNSILTYEFTLFLGHSCYGLPSFLVPRLLRSLPERS